MPRQATPLINEEIYHISLRAVGDTHVFNNEDDFYRGIFCIYEFNNAKLIEIRKRREKRKKEKASGSPTPADDRELLVEVLAFCFMPNHMHLLLRQLKDNGISRFMQKVGGGYANYYNKKYSRKGHLFNKFHAVHIENDNQLRAVFDYIHCNPISFVEPGWKENGIKSPQKAKKFLAGYKWSSYQDYIGKKNFQSVTVRDFISDFIGGPKQCRRAIEKWADYRKRFGELPEIFLE